MRGQGNSYPPHGRHINDAFPGLWPLRFRRSLRQAATATKLSLSVILKSCPFYGGQAPPPACPASTPPSKPVHPRLIIWPDRLCSRPRWGGAEKCYLWKGSGSLSGSGYSTPWVSTVTDFMTCGFFGLLFIMFRGADAMASTTSIPSMTMPKAAY